MNRLAVLFILTLLVAGCASPRQSIDSTPTPKSSSSPTGTATPTQTPRPSATVTPTRPASCFVANTDGEVLNVRKGPSLTAEIIGGLLPGQRLAVITWGKEWNQIRAGDLAGFVAAKYCEVKK